MTAAFSSSIKFDQNDPLSFASYLRVAGPIKSNPRQVRGRGKPDAFFL